MTTRLFLALAAALLIARLPSIVQPMGADQGLYAYVGERIQAGELPYRDAWDQKPPAIHYTYALMRVIWQGDGAVPAADLAAAALGAWLLYRLGSIVAPGPTGAISALLFLLLSNPSFTRLSGVRLRAQSETFIAVAVTGAFLLLARYRHTRRDGHALGAGLLVGIAIAFKYNAGVYALAGLAALWVWTSLNLRAIAAVAAGASMPMIVLIVVFWTGGALRDLYDATIHYNLLYSGETYTGPIDFLRYVIAFPIARARVDALWTVGGAGCIVLILGSVDRRERLVPVLWVATACVAIAVNGSRGLPQYFVQANAALAFAAAWGGVVAWSFARAFWPRARTLVAAAGVLLVSTAVWRVNQFPKLVEQTWFDSRYAAGAMPRDEYLARFDDDRKYSALAAARLGGYLSTHSSPGDRVYVFGFTCASYVIAERSSASRFFWSRPVIVGFNGGMNGYGTLGLLADLEEQQPAVIALQRHDWEPDVMDSARFFMNEPPLAEWLQAHYMPAVGPEGFDIWLRRAATVHE